MVKTLRFALVLAACTVVAVGAMLWLTAPYNPLLIAFLTTFEIRNDSGVDLQVMPIGQGSAHLGPLPQYESDEPPVHRVRQTAPKWLAAGATLRVVYDWDDVSFRHILVRSRGGPLLILDTDRAVGCCYSPRQTLYVIPRLTTLRRAPPELEMCRSGKYVEYSRLQER